MRRAGLLLLVTLALPTAAAQVSVDDVRVPDRTAAAKPFNVDVTLRNDGDARTVYLFGALYAHEPGADPCGPATDPRFRTFTHIVQEPIELPARSTIDHPPPGERWLHRYQARDAPPQPTLAQFCVFIANASAGPRIDYEDFDTAPLWIRAVNQKPAPTITWTPETPLSRANVTFRAEATDAEGDPITFAWDFGHVNASGRARATGPSATHFFYPAGEYVVTLVASDGLDNATTTAIVTVVDDAPTDRARLPLPAALAIGAAALAAATRSRARAR